MGVNKGHPMTLCWGCQNTSRHKCSWFDPDNPQPVPGWTAEQSYVSRIGDSYHVVACPNFLPLNQLKVPGVSYKPESGKWRVQIGRGGKYYHMGMFSKKEDAIAARRAAEESLARGEEPKMPESAKVCGVQALKWGKWSAKIHYQGQQLHLGTFDTKDAAIAARRAAEEAIERGEEPRRKLRR